MPFLHQLLPLVVFILVTISTAEAVDGSPKTEQDDISGSVLENKTAIIEEAFKQIEDAADRLIANGDSLWKIKDIVEAKRSEAKTADFNRKIKTILGPSTTVKVRFLRYSYDETFFGDEKHILEWDILRKTDTTEAAAAAENDAKPSSSYRFSLRDPLETVMDFNLPRGWGEFKFTPAGVLYWKDNSQINEWARREFSYRQAVPGLFQEMSETLGVLETDLQTALEAIATLAQRRIYFDHVFESTDDKETNEEL